MFELTTPKGEILPFSLRDAWAHVLVAEDITDPADIAGYMGYARINDTHDAIGAFNDFWTEFGWRLAQPAGIIRYARVLWRDKVYAYRNRHDYAPTMLSEYRGMWRNSIQDARYAYRVLVLGETL